MYYYCACKGAQEQAMCGCQQDGQSLDLRPEFCFYQDAGCEVGESCLNCPLPVCVYDEPDGKRRLRYRIRAQEMARQFSVVGKSTEELATIYGVSRRTVQRVLKTVFDKGSDKGVFRDD